MRAAARGGEASLASIEIGTRPETAVARLVAGQADEGWVGELSIVGSDLLVVRLIRLKHQQACVVKDVMHCIPRGPWQSGSLLRRYRRTIVSFRAHGIFRLAMSRLT